PGFPLHRNRGKGQGEGAGGHRGGHFSSPPSRRMKNSPDKGSFVSREKSNDFPLGEKTAPISLAFWLTSGPSLTFLDQPFSVRRDAQRRPSAMMIKREPSGEGSGSFSSSAVLISSPRFSTSHFPGAVSRARQMSVAPCPPGRSDPK